MPMKFLGGGTGYGIYDTLPDAVERSFPDYSIYPDVDYAIGFLTRGCIRACPWCVVPKKEGKIHPAGTWQEIKRPDSRNIVFLDNNVLACDHGLSQIDDMGGKKVWVDFNQGLDARLITHDVAALLKRLRWIKYIRVSCDTDEMIPVIEQARAYLREAGCKTRLFSYMLVQDIDSAHRRALALRSMGIDPYAQPYRDYENHEPTDEQKRFARWVNHKATFKTCAWEDYTG